MVKKMNLSSYQAEIAKLKKEINNLNYQLTKKDKINQQVNYLKSLFNIFSWNQK